MMSQWIKVEDEMPELNTWVLSVDDNGIMRVASFMGKKYDNHWWDEYALVPCVPITHWQPLPELP
jgi:hypothetical protein